MQPSIRTRRTLWIVIAAVALIGLSVLGYLYRSRIKLGLGLLVDETGSRSMAVVCVVLGLFAVASLLLWMLLPFLIYAGLKDLRRRASDLAESTSLCARHLSRLADERDRLQARKLNDPPSSASLDQAAR